MTSDEYRDGDDSAPGHLKESMIKAGVIVITAVGLGYLFKMALVVTEMIV